MRLAFFIRVGRVTLLASLLFGALSVSSASAVTEHVFVPPAVGSAGSGAGQLSLRPPDFSVEGTGVAGSGVALNQSTGALYVADTNNHRVDEFDAEGHFVLAWGWGVADGLPMFETCVLSCQPGLSGSSPGEFEAPALIAVDNSVGASAGDVYVADLKDNLLTKFTASGVLVKGWGTEGQLNIKSLPSEPTRIGPEPAKPVSSLAGVAVDAAGELFVYDQEGNMFQFEQDGTPKTVFTSGFGVGRLGIAVDSNDDLYVVRGSGAIAKFEASSGFLTGTFGGCESECVTSLAVDPANNDVYLAKGNHVSRYNSAGELQEPQFGSENLTAASGIAVRGSDHLAYVADAGASTVDPFGLATVPDTTTLPATNLSVTTAELHGEVNPEGTPLTECVFEYGTSTTYGHAAPCVPSAVEIGSATEPKPVHALVEGLSPDTTYHFRLRAGNANGRNRGADETFLTPSPPLVSSSSANVTSTSADLRAQVNPLGAATAYRFEYGTTASYGVTVPVPDEQIGAGSEPQSVSQHLQTLTPGTVYHYHVVATNQFGTEASSDHTFTTQGAGGTLSLPDSRAWELVSPADKHGALIEPLTQVLTQASPDGSRMLYTASSPVEAQPPGSLFKTRVLALRGAGGWSSQSLVVPHEAAAGPAPEEWQFFSEDLSRAIVEPAGAFPASGSPDSLSPEASEQTAFLHTNLLAGSPGERCTSSCFGPLVTGKAGFANVPPGTVFGVDARTGETCPPSSTCGPVAQAATPDLSHIVLGSAVGLTEGASGKGVWEWTAGKLTPVAQGGLTVDGVSDDGSRIVISPPTTGEGLLLRDTALGQTVRLDAPAPGVTPTGLVSPLFRFATRDGSAVFFSDRETLTKDSGANGTVAPEEEDLYECRLLLEGGKLRCSLTDLTPLGEGAEHANVPEAGVVDISADGSWVYFVANGKLGSAAGRGNCEPAGTTVATCNLFVRHGGETRLIAVLSSLDRPDWTWGTGELIHHTSRVSPDGQWLTFMSQLPLTGYDNRDAVTGNPDEEVFLYHAPTGTLVCASCNPTGARPVGVEYAKIDTTASGGLAGGDAVWKQEQGIAANIPSWTAGALHEERERYQSRFLSNTGRLYFNSHDALVPQDVNRTEDVYQYEPPGQGDCSTASSTFSPHSRGCVGLISSGTDAGESAFLDASESGGDVFFLTSAHLSPQDVDSSLDIYDAHECTTSSPCLPQPAASPPPCTTGEACKPAPTPQPGIFGSPASSTFSGPGNPPPAPTSVKPLTNTQKLAKALTACRAKYRHSKKRRSSCERTARHTFAARKATVTRRRGK